MRLILDIRVLATADAQQFVIPLDLTGPATLTIKPSNFGIGHQVGILDEHGQRLAWYAHELIGLRFEST